MEQQPSTPTPTPPSPSLSSAKIDSRLLKLLVECGLAQHSEALTKDGLRFDTVDLLTEEDLIKLGEPKFLAREKLNKLKLAHRAELLPPRNGWHSRVFLAGKTSIVTGSTSGIGLGIAESLAARGSNIVLSGSRSEDQVKHLIHEFTSKYEVKVIYCQADLSKPAEAAEKLIAAAVTTFGGLDILVNNAGIQYVSSIEHFPPEEWERVLNTNLTSCFHIMRLAIPVMKKNAHKWGRIINISSVHGIVASVHKAAYIASKHGLNGLTKVAALELAADTQITVNAICPGWVNTELVRKQIHNRAEQKKISFEEATESLVGEKQPSRRFTSCEAIGDYVAFLCSEAGANITGAAQVIDGAWTTQ